MKTYTKQSLIDQLRVIRDKGWIQNNKWTKSSFRKEKWINNKGE